jgi:predicted enzyme related to lactoylglutathione lyase
MPNPVVHWEIAALDAKKQQDFYARLFDWKIQVHEAMNYGIVETGGSGGINGGIFTSQTPGCKLVTFYVQVDDLQAYLDKATKLGGKTVMPPTPIPGHGSMAMFQDPEGNVLGLFKGN